MQQLHQLLVTDNSKLAWVLRLGLYGLQTQLQVALEDCQDDPGSQAVRDLLEELNTLLATPSSSESIELGDFFEPVFPEDSPPLPTRIKQPKLKSVADGVGKAREVFDYIGQYSFKSDNDADLWHEIQRLLLRLPDKEVSILQERIWHLVNQLGATEDERSLLQLPFTRHEVLYAGLTGTVKAQGLCCSDSDLLKFDSRLMVEPRGSELDSLAGILSIYLKFIEQLDSANLHHALKSIDRFRIKPLDSKLERDKYVAALLERFRRVRVTLDKDPAIALKARLDLDEAIHSLLYLPPADRYSWWGRLQQEARRTLDPWITKARQVGYLVQIRPLWGSYADVYKLSKDDIQIDLGGIPGEVSACLRVYAVINDEVLPGRVIFRSS